MIKHYCDRCEDEIKPSSYPKAVPSGTINGHARYTMGGEKLEYALDIKAINASSNSHAELCTDCIVGILRRQDVVRALSDNEANADEEEEPLKELRPECTCGSLYVRWAKHSPTCPVYRGKYTFD